MAVKPELLEKANVSFEGTILAPPALVKALPPPQNPRVFLEIYRDYIRDPILRTDLGEVKSFPHEFKVPIPPGILVGFRRRRIVPLSARAYYCYVRPKADSPCSAFVATPRLYGALDLWQDLASVDAGESKISIPPIVLNTRAEAWDQEVCKKEKVFSGTIQPTAAFLAENHGEKRFALIAFPQGDRFDPGEPYSAGPNSERPLRDDEVAALDGKVKIPHGFVTINGAKPVPFSFPSLSPTRYAIYLSECSAGQADRDCLAQAFPIDRQSVIGPLKTGKYKLVPAGFELPACGTKNLVMYLHKWNSTVPAKEASVLNSAIPELYEGASY